MQNRIIRFSLLFALLSSAGLYAKQSLQEAEMALEASFKSVNNAANFPSMQLFSVADMKRKTYAVKQSKSLCLTRSASYSPTTELVGSPAFQVLASTVILDLNGQTLTKFVETPEVRCVGIEVGYSKAAIDASEGALTINSQPQNVIIRNGNIDNFDIALVIHKGVKHVRLENLTITNSPVGIVMMGDDSAANEEVASIIMENCKIVGAQVEDSSALAWAKDKIETADSDDGNGLGFNYGDYSFIDQENPVYNDTATRMYVGVVARHVNNIMMNGIEVDGLGYKTNDNNNGIAEGSITRGFDIMSSNNIFMKNCRASNLLSTADAVGACIQDSTSVAIKNSEFNNNSVERVNRNTSNARRCIGVYLVDVDSVQLHNVECNKNQADSSGDENSASSEAYGILLDSGNAIDMYNVVATNNQGFFGIACGMKLEDTVSLKMKKIISEYNNGSNSVNGIYLADEAHAFSLEDVSANGTNGSNATGIRIDYANGGTFKDVKANGTHGSGAIYGIYFDDGVDSVVLENVSVTGTESYNSDAVGLYMSGANGVTLKDVNADYAQGNYTRGIFIDGANAIHMEGVSAAHAEGDTVYGMHIVSGNGLVMKNINVDKCFGDSDTRGIFFETRVNALQLSDVTATAIASYADNVYALYFDQAESITAKNIACNYTRQTNSAYDVYVVYFSYTAQDIDFDGLQVSNGYSNGDSFYGVYFYGDAQAISLKNFEANSNESSGNSSMIHFDGNAHSIRLENVVLDNNYNDSSTLHGVYFDNGFANLCIKNMSFCNNESDSGRNYALYADDSCAALDINGFVCNKNYATSDISAIYINGAMDSLVLKKASINANEAYSESYLFNVDGVAKSVTLEDVTIDSNVVYGALFQGVYLFCPENTTMKNVSVSGNVADGELRGLNFDFDFDEDSLTNSAVLTDITLNSNKSTESDLSALWMGAATNIKIRNISASYNKAHDNVVGLNFPYFVNALDVFGASCNANTVVPTYSGEPSLSVNSGEAYGMYLESPTAIRLENISADYNNSFADDVYGIYLGSESSAITMKNVTANNNVAVAGAELDGSDVAAIEASATGIEIHDSTAVSMENIACNYNVATQNSGTHGFAARGYIKGAHLKNISCDSNKQESSGTDGYTHAIHLENPQSVDMMNVSCCKNTGDTEVYGLLLDARDDEGSNITITDSLFNGNQAFQEQVSMQQQMSNGAPIQVSNGVAIQADMSKHMPTTAYDDLLDGAFGIFNYGVNSCVLRNVDACKNVGARAGGMYFAYCQDITLQGCKASYQTASGDYFVRGNSYYVFDGDDLISLVAPLFVTYDGDGNPITISDADNNTVQQVNLNYIYNPTYVDEYESTATPGIYQDKYSDLYDAIDAEAATYAFLAALREVKYLLDIDGYDVAETSVYNNILNMVAAQQLVSTAMTPFRRFSTAVGVQLHSCSNCMVEDLAAVGNSSAKDSAIGLGTSGAVRDMKFIRVNASGNQAWTDSAKQDNGDIDISATMPFWQGMDAYVLNRDTNDDYYNAESGVDYTDPIDSEVNSAQIGYQIVNTTNPDPDLANLQPDGNSVWSMNPDLTSDVTPKDRLPITFGDGGYPFEEFASVVGGESIGILIGDAAESIEVSMCDGASNNANAGRAFGMLQDTTTGLVAKDNRFYQSSANDLGYCFGMCETTVQSNSVHVGNVMFGNSVGDNANFNYAIPFDPAAHPNIYFPRKTAYNGDFTQFANASPFDNLVIEFVTAKQENPYAPTGMFERCWYDWTIED